VTRGKAASFPMPAKTVQRFNAVNGGATFLTQTYYPRAERVEKFYLLSPLQESDDIKRLTKMFIGIHIWIFYK
jgi:hypothetical protein